MAPKLLGNQIGIGTKHFNLHFHKFENVFYLQTG